MMKRMTALLAAAFLALALTMISFAAGWYHDGTGWRWYNQDGSVITGSWQWLDGNGDGIAECYCFAENGYIYQNTVTPDNYTVNADGAWTVNGAVQIRRTGSTGPIVQAGSAASFQQTAAAAAAAGTSQTVSAEQAAGIASYFADNLYVFSRNSRLFNTETNRSEMSFDQVCAMARYYGLFIRDSRVITGAGPIFIGKDAMNSILKEVFGKYGRPAMERLESTVMVVGDQFVFNYGEHDGSYTIAQGTLQYGVENGLLKISAGVNPVRDSEEDGYFTAWFSPSGAEGLYGWTFERIELRKYR